MFLCLSFAQSANAHRSGCHRWHSCPSDRGTYTCGDTGHCNYCPNNDYCKNGEPRTEVDRKEFKKRKQTKENR